MAGQIFNGNINATATAWMMIYMLAFAVMWETFCGWLEKRYEDNRASSELLSKVGRELIILGFIAFAVILLKEVDVLHFNSETLHVFEFCDLLVSICVLIYVANCAVSSLTMSGTQREWDRIAMTQTATIMEGVQRHVDSIKGSARSRLKHSVPIFGQAWRAEAEFKILQLLFETKFRMSVQFDYVAYIKVVLQGVVVSMANISALHWALIMAINGLWWLFIQIVMPALDMHATPDDHICLFQTECGLGSAAHRRLAAAASSAAAGACRSKLAIGEACTLVSSAGDSCSLNATLQQALNATLAPGAWTQCAAEAAATAHADIGAKETHRWLLVFVLIGWVVALLQAVIVSNIHSRMDHVFACCGAGDDCGAGDVQAVLGSLQRSLVKHEQALLVGGAVAEAEADVESQSITVEGEAVKGKFHYMHHLITLDALMGEGDADHIMVFAEAGKNSNDILSVRTFELLVFATQFLQLVLDFYLGFYLVHMRHRVPKAYGHESLGEGHVGSQLLIHLGVLTPVALMLYLLMMMARNIALLFGVLHLNEDAVSHVLQHMELVKSIRRRIQDTLEKTKMVRGKSDPQAGKRMLDKANLGEVEVLKLLAKRAASEPICVTEMQGMLAAQGHDMLMSAADLDSFVDRADFEALQLLDPAHQATAQTARTLNIRADDCGKDTITVREFSAFVTRFVALILDDALALSVEAAEAAKFLALVSQLDSVDALALEQARRLSRAKALFRASDKDKSGTLERQELYKALRHFKVPVTHKEYREVFRVLDPDQTLTLSMAEWVDFMTATDAGVDLQTKGEHARKGERGATDARTFKRASVHPEPGSPKNLTEAETLRLASPSREVP